MDAQRSPSFVCATPTRIVFVREEASFCASSRETPPKHGHASAYLAWVVLRLGHRKILMPCHKSQHWDRRRSSSTGGRGATVLPYFTVYRPPGRVHTALEGSVSGLGGRKWLKESAIEAEHASARKLFNSSLPWGLGSGANTSAKHTPPVSMIQRPRCFSVHARRMILLVRPILRALRVQPPSPTFRWPVTAADIDMSFSPPHFRKGQEAMKGFRRIHRQLYYGSWRE